MATTIIESDIYQGFSGDWLQRGGEYYVAKADAEAFLRHLNTNHVDLIGIEGFVLHHNTTMSVMNTIADYSAGAPTSEDLSAYLNGTTHLVSHFCFVIDVSSNVTES